MSKNVLALLATCLSLVLLVVAVQSATATPANSNCCFPGSECCVPGAGCCEAKSCCVPGAECCFPGAACCEASQPVSLKIDTSNAPVFQLAKAKANTCCTAKATCCEAKAECCKDAE